MGFAKRTLPSRARDFLLCLVHYVLKETEVYKSVDRFANGGPLFATTMELSQLCLHAISELEWKPLSA